MFKKIIIGIFCFIFVAGSGIGIYIYTLNWNKYKSNVARRLTEITGLNAQIDGDLSVKLFPTPEFTMNMVKFSKPGIKEPLVIVNRISSKTELLPLFSNKFILSGMSLTQANINIVLDENGNINWTDATKAGPTKSGVLDVSFNDIKLINANISYKNKIKDTTYDIPNINGTVNATSLKGPYKINTKFTHNKQEFLVKGDVSNNNNIIAKVNISNPATSSLLSIDGGVSNTKKGVITFETSNLHDITSIIFGREAISNKYAHPLFLSFQYNASNDGFNLENFTLRYANNTAGSGKVNINKDEKVKIFADIDMIQFDLDLISNIAQDIKDCVAAGNKFEESQITKYDTTIDIKAKNAWLKGTNAQDLILSINSNDGIINVNRFGAIFAGETNIVSSGALRLVPEYGYNFDLQFKSNDIKSFASIYGLNPTKYAKEDDKKVIFKNAQGNANIKGNINDIEISFKDTLIDASNIDGNIGLVYAENNKNMILFLNASKILFDKYFDTSIDKDEVELTFDEKLAHHFNLIPWKNTFNVDGVLNIENGVYSDVAFNNLKIDFSNADNNLNIKSLSIDSLAGAELSLKGNFDNIYELPRINELTYDVKTSNFPLLTSSMKIDTGKLNLFKSKTFKTQGAMSGSFDDLTVSSMQKFDDVEFTYSGSIKTVDNEKTFVEGELELKTNNFLNLPNVLNINYQPNIPVSNFLLSANVMGNMDLFALDKVNAYLGTNNIVGNIKFDKTNNIPVILGNIGFDSFNVNSMFNIKKPAKEQNTPNKPFIEKSSFTSEPFDFSALKDVNLDLAVNSKKVLYNNKKFTDTKLNIALNDGILNISNFETKLHDSELSGNVVLNSNSVPKINGDYDLKNYITKDICGSVYCINTGILSSKGSFDSIATSKESFINNLNANGYFELNNTSITGWDTDIIKFEFEQRKTSEGLSDTVLDSLKTGKTNFTSINGLFNIAQGVIVADKINLISTVINMVGDLELNLEKWDMNTNFEGIYHNATFTDALKFSMSGNIENPTVNVDLDETVSRLNKYEKNILEAKDSKEKQKKEAFLAKKTRLQENIKLTLNDLGKMALDVIKYKPVTPDEKVQNTYKTNIDFIQSTEKELNKMLSLLDNAKSEKEIADIEAQFMKQSSELNFIPKTLEDNYIVDSKIVFDDSFNMLAWLYDVAQNNVSYYKGLTDVYMDQIDFLEKTNTPVDPEKKKILINDIKKITDDMKIISDLQSKVRDNYLNIIDTATISTMNNNNKVANQAVETMFAYLKKLNENIVISINRFSDVLNINSKDYDSYLVYPPTNIDEINPAAPTINENQLKEDNSPQLSSEKKNKLKISLDNITGGLLDVLTKLNPGNEEADTLDAGDSVNSTKNKAKNAKQLAGLVEKNTNPEFVLPGINKGIGINPETLILGTGKNIELAQGENQLPLGESDFVLPGINKGIDVNPETIMAEAYDNELIEPELTNEDIDEFTKTVLEPKLNLPGIKEKSKKSASIATREEIDIEPLILSASDVIEEISKPEIFAIAGRDEVGIESILASAGAIKKETTLPELFAPIARDEIIKEPTVVAENTTKESMVKPELAVTNVKGDVTKEPTVVAENTTKESMAKPELAVTNVKGDVAKEPTVVAENTTKEGMVKAELATTNAKGDVAKEPTVVAENTTKEGMTKAELADRKSTRLNSSHLN